MRAIVAVIALVACAGCVSIDRTGAPTSTVPAGEVYQAADLLRRGQSGRHTGSGTGESMAPMYGENTMLVITPIDFDKLEQGMVVAYRSRDGRRIVHTLAFKDGDKWIAQGINNRVYDPEAVTRDNLLGVVYAVLNAAPVQVPLQAPK